MHSPPHCSVSHIFTIHKHAERFIFYSSAIRTSHLHIRCDCANIIFVHIRMCMRRGVAAHCVFNKFMTLLLCSESTLCRRAPPIRSGDTENWILTPKPSQSQVWIGGSRQTHTCFDVVVIAVAQLAKAPWEIKFSQSYALEQNVLLVSERLKWNHLLITYLLSNMRTKIFIHMHMSFVTFTLRLHSARQRLSVRHTKKL